MLTGFELALLKNGLRKAGSALGHAALTGPGPGAGSVEKRLRTSRVPGLERRKQTIESGDAERFARRIMEWVSGQRFILPGKATPVLDELLGVVCEHIVEFFTTKETFSAAADLELLKQSARDQPGRGRRTVRRQRPAGAGEAARDPAVRPGSARGRPGLRLDDRSSISKP